MNIKAISIEENNGKITEYTNEDHTFSYKESDDGVYGITIIKNVVKFSTNTELASYILKNIYQEFDVDLDDAPTKYDGYVLKDLAETELFCIETELSCIKLFLDTLSKHGISENDVQCMESNYKLVMYEDYNQYEIVLRIKDTYFKFTGTYCSYEGLNLDLDHPIEVFPEEKIVTIYK